MNTTTVNFIFKKGIAPDTKSGVRISKGTECILVYDKDRCVGLVFWHDEKGVSAHRQAEIGFFSSFEAEYGQWHRIFVGEGGKDRLQYAQLEAYLTKEKEFLYTADLNFVKK